MNSSKGLAGFFLVSYEEAPFLVRSKAKAFLYFCLIMLALLMMLAAVFALILPEIIMQAYAAIIAMLAAMLLGLVLLRRGRYYAAANLIAVIGALAMIAGLLAKVNRDAYAGYTTFIYFMLVMIILTSLFCKRSMLIAVSAAYLASDVLFFFLARNNLDPISLKAARVGLVDSSFSIVFACVLSYLILHITDGAIAVSEKESETSRARFDLIQKLLGSVRDTAGNLASSSAVLSATASEFSDNSQSQASSAEEIMATVEEVSAGVESVDAGAREQFERLESLIARMDELSSTINEMGGTISETLGITGTVAQRARAGSELLGSMDESMKKIAASSGEITGIVSIINDISDQINLLSLNASIEAARAGEAGRGFAVVADAVSKLADQTASSIREIDALIRTNKEEIEKGIANATGTIATMSGIIEGVEAVNRMHGEISRIMQRQREINGLVNGEALRVKTRSDEIKAATDEQKKAVNEIVQSITHVNEITQSNAMSAEKMLESVRGFESIADDLRKKFEAEGTDS